VQAEVDTVLGAAELLSDYSDVRKLTYLEAVTHETMRLKPVAPLNGHQTLVGVDLDGVHIPAGTTVVPLTRPAALQSDTFPEPEKFKPERWLGDGNGADAPHPQAFMPFGSGPRLCPGRSLALLEIKTAMAMVCRNFDLLPAEEVGQVEERFAFTMMPANLFVRFSQR
jgi:cytochrome P450